MSVEASTFAFLEEAVAGAAQGTALAGAELHDTTYEVIKTDYGVRIGDCVSEFAPLPGGDLVDEFDGLVTLICFARVVGPDKTHRHAAREKSLDISKAVAKLFLDDPSMNGRVRDSRVLWAARGYDSIGAEPYAVCRLQMIVNETGQQTTEHRGWRTELRG
jgi:hypothetical protein